MLTTAAQVRALSPEVAETGVEVKLEAVVTFVDSPGTVFVQQDGHGTFLRFNSVPETMRPGQVLSVSGSTFPGLFLPGVQVTTFSVLGEINLPQAQPCTFDDLQSGRFHYQRVSIEGVVRAVLPREEDKSTLRLAVGHNILEIRVDEAPRDITDQVVRITGLAAGHINHLRQLVQPYIRISNWSDVETLQPAVPLQLVPVLKPADVLKFDPQGEQRGRRVRVEGIITALFPQRRLWFLQDESGSVAVEAVDGTEVSLGDRLRVSGFPTMQRFTPVMADTLSVETLEQSMDVTPRLVSSSSWGKEVQDGDLITLTGRVTDSYRGMDGWHIKVSSGTQRITIVSPQSAQPAVQIGQQVRATGIIRIESVVSKGYNSVPDTWAMWLRSGQDLAVIGEASPWTARRLLQLLGVFFALAAGAMVWVYLLKRQVARLQAKVRTEAVMEERQRIAREFHDTLEQELAGLSLRLDAALTRPLDEKAQALLSTSRQLVSRVQVEARNIVADLRQAPEASLDLEQAIRTLLEQQPANAPPSTLQVTGQQHALPPHVVHHLRMIVQEALTNVIKHAQASQVSIQQMILTVTDDGKGIPLSADTPPTAPGHFGCIGIQERSKRIGATVRWLVENGTTLEVTLPL
jgi:signal transduction histidine kinase